MSRVVVDVSVSRVGVWCVSRLREVEFVCCCGGGCVSRLREVEFVCVTCWGVVWGCLREVEFMCVMLFLWGGEGMRGVFVCALKVRVR